MKIAVGSDESTQLTSAVIKNLKKRSYILNLFSPISSIENGNTDTNQLLTSGKAAKAIAMFFAMLYLGNKLIYKQIGRIRELEERNAIRGKS